MEEFEGHTSISKNVSPATTLAKKFVDQGDDVETAKSSTLKLVKSMGIELDKEDLFGDSASNRLLLDDDKSATIFAAFNAVNNLQRTLVETVNAEIKREGLEEDLKSIREKTMEKLVISIKSKGEEMSIDEVIGEALEASTHFVGNSIETAKKNIITSEIVEKSNKIVNAHKPTEVEGKVSTLQERIIAIETESFDRSNQEVINSLVMLEKEPEVSKEAFELSLITKRDEEKVRVSQEPKREPEVQLVDFIELKQNGVAKTNHPMKNYTYVKYNTMDEAKFAHEVVDMNEAKANLELTAKEAGLVSVDDAKVDKSLSFDSPFAKLSAPTNIKTLAPLFSASESLEIRNGLIGNEKMELRFDDKLNKWYAIDIAPSVIKQQFEFEAKSVTELVEGENQPLDYANNYMSTQRRQQLVSEGDFKLIEGDFDGHKVYSLDFCVDNSLLAKDSSTKLKSATMEDAPIAAATSATELIGDVAKDVVMTVYAIATELVDVLSKIVLQEPGGIGNVEKPNARTIVSGGTYNITGLKANTVNMKEFVFQFLDITAESDPQSQQKDVYYLHNEEFTFRKNNMITPFGQPWEFSYDGTTHSIQEEDLTFDGQNTPTISIRIDGVPTDVRLLVNQVIDHRQGPIATPIGDVSEEPIAKPIGDVSEEPKEEPEPIEGGDEDPAQIDNGEKPKEGPIGEPISTIPIGGEPIGDDGFDVQIDFLNTRNLHGDGSEHTIEKLKSMVDEYQKMMDSLDSDRLKRDNLGKDYDPKLYDKSRSEWESYHIELKGIIELRNGN